VAKIDRVEDLPDWFDLEKYKGCEGFRAAEWLAHLDIRSYLLSGNPAYPEEALRLPCELFADSGIDPEAYHQNYIAHANRRWKENIRFQAEALRSDPVRFPLPHSCDEFLRWKVSPIQPVRSVVFGDLATALHIAINNLTLDGNDEINRQLEGWDYIGHDIQAGAKYLEDFRDNSEPYAPLGPRYMQASKELEDTPVEPARWESLISVDLQASDAALMESFKAWVKEARSHQRFAATSRRKSSYDRWARYGLLPYLDLLTWSLETDTHIPDRVMSAAISRYDAGEANLRKTIGPLAADLMRDLSGLQVLAGIEGAGRASENTETMEG
tara:strand:- start:953 stop:1933 length:981 start_codon:yes stop_codon:yes gene_type:complete